VEPNELATLDPQTLELLRSFGFSRRQKREVWDAFLEDPDGFERCALNARVYGKREGTTGAGLLLTMIRRDDHRLKIDKTARRVTGWRWVHTLQAGTYLEDPLGTDPLPPGYGVEG
jgi:hypothetical protein